MEKTRKKSKRKLDTMKKISALLIKGFTNKEIAKQIGLSECTINNYVMRLLDEKDCANRTQLAVKLAIGG